MLPTPTTNIVVVTEFATAVVYVTVTPSATSAVVNDYGSSSSSGDYGYDSTSGTIKTSEMAGEADFAGGIPVAKRARRHHSHGRHHPQVLA